MVGPDRAASAVVTPSDEAVESAEAGGALRDVVFGRTRPHWPLYAVLASFALSMAIVPTFAGVTLSDDWIYMRSVRILVEEGRLDIHPLVAPNLLFQVLWGGLFGSLFGVTAGVMRLSTVVLWVLSGIAFYALAWELTGKRALSALGTAAYLFNPLGYVLAFSFMTDAPFAALLVISTYCTVRGLRNGIDGRWMVAGSVATAAAVLVRQPGVLIPPAVLLALFLTGRLTLSRRAVLVAAQVGAIPLFAYIAYYLWMKYANGTSETQSLMLRELTAGGPGAVIAHAVLMWPIEAVYVGLFVLPVGVGAALRLGGLLRGLPRRAFAYFVVWETLVVGGFVILHAVGMRMPYIPHFFSDAGLGPNDLHAGGRASVMGHGLRTALTFVSVASVVVAGLLVVRTFARERRDSTGVVLVLVALAVQAAGALIVSAHFRFGVVQGLPSPSLDRYLLPLLPLALVTAVWAARSINIHLPTAWCLTAVLAAFAVAGTRDNLVFHQATWDFAHSAVESGIPMERLDAGAPWTGYHLGDRSYDERGAVIGYGRWWLGLYGLIIDPEYVIATAEVEGYTTIREYPYDLWLDRRPTVLYLLRRAEETLAP